MSKTSTLILEVDLACCLCYKKIRRTLCKLQDRWNIQTIVYDEKNNVVTISGPFDPHKLSKKLCCKACKVIKDIHIQPDPPPPQPTPPPAPPEPDPPAPPPPEPAPEPAPPPPPAPAPPPPEPVPEPAPAPAPEPKKPEPEPPKQEPACCRPVWPYVPVCCCWYHGACRCCTCDRGYGWAPVGPPVVNGGPCYEGYKTCELICEEDASCRIM